MVKELVHGRDEVLIQGDVPAVPHLTPGEVETNGIFYKNRKGEIMRSPALGVILDNTALKESVRTYISAAPGYARKLREAKKDVIAVMHGKTAKIMIGVGLAGLITSGAIVGTIVFKRRHPKHQ